jgi:hypothetical protein
MELSIQIRALSWTLLSLLMSGGKRGMRLSSDLNSTNILLISFSAPPTSFECVNNTIDKCSDECPEHIFNRSVFKETIITEWDLVCIKGNLASLSQTINMLGILLGNMIFGTFADK